MLASKLFAAGIQRRRLAEAIDGFFKRVAAAYRRALEATLAGRASRSACWRRSP